MPLVDSDILIDIQRGHPPAVASFGSLTALPEVPGFVVMELIQDARNNLEVRQALRLTSPFTIVWATEIDCARVLATFAAYHLSQGVSILDALIGECAVGRSTPLYTFNTKHYRVIPGLVIQEPYKR